MTESTISILQVNVEGLTEAKRQIIRRLANEHQANVLLLQETHAEKTDKLQIEEFNLIDFISHNKHGIATYCRDGLDAKKIGVSSTRNPIQWVKIEINGTYIANVYKPPPAAVTPSCLPTANDNTVIGGDFNSRHTNWGYTTTNDDGEQ